jgi:hypothetical protein
MAIANMASRYKYSISAFQECIEHMQRVYSSRTHDTYDPGGSRLLESSHASAVSASI